MRQFRPQIWLPHLDLTLLLELKAWPQHVGGARGTAAKKMESNLYNTTFFV